MAAIDKRSNGRWRIRIRNRRAPALSKTFTRKADAMKWARDTEILIEQGHFTQTDNKLITLKDILEYITALNDYVIFDTTNITYNDLDDTRKIVIDKIEFLVLLLIDKLKNILEKYSKNMMVFIFLLISMSH